MWALYVCPSPSDSMFVWRCSMEQEITKPNRVKENPRKERLEETDACDRQSRPVTWRPSSLKHCWGAEEKAPKKSWKSTVAVIHLIYLAPALICRRRKMHTDTEGRRNPEIAGPSFAIFLLEPSNAEVTPPRPPNLFAFFSFPSAFSCRKIKKGTKGWQEEMVLV